MTLLPEFTFSGLTTRVLFGSGTLGAVADEITRLGCKKAMILSTDFQADEADALAGTLGQMVAGQFTEAAMHTPVEVTDKALEVFKSSGADCIVALGGGSTIGLGKAIATRTGVDQIAIPTTYAGSEMTDILGETKAGYKTTRRDPSIRPETVIYDVDLTLNLPVPMTMTSALNAIAHSVEAFYAPDTNPIINLMGVDAMRAFKAALPVLKNDPQNKEARSQILYGAWLCSTALGYVSMALHHKLCHTLGGCFDTPHADTHAILLPHTTGFNSVAVSDKLGPIEEIFGDTPGVGLWNFATQIGAPTKLQDLGLTEADLDRAADIAVENPYENPRLFDRSDIRILLQQAWEGACPNN